MATNDMRLSLDFVDHPKVRKLIRKAGYEAFYSLIKLFSMAGKLYPDGYLKGCGVEDIEDISDWRGEAGFFIKSLIDVGFLDSDARGYTIHDWFVHQPWLSHADVRSEQARKAATERWKSRENDDSNTENADSIQSANLEHAERNADSNAPSPIPNPIPNPNPIPIPKENKKSGDLEAIRLASLLLERSRVYDPKIAIGKDKQTINSWSKDIERLIRLDKRTPQEVEDVIRWCKSKGNFWIPNILSGKKLREKFPTLFSQMTSRGKSNQKSLKRYGTESGDMGVDEYMGG